MLDPDVATLGRGSACVDAGSPEAGTKAGAKSTQKVSWADTSDAHDEAEYACSLSNVCVCGYQHCRPRCNVGSRKRVTVTRVCT
eukprot:10200841-Alexandrium_andersonii.AAC.1